MGQCRPLWWGLVQLSAFISSFNGRGWSPDLEETLRHLSQDHGQKGKDRQMQEEEAEGRKVS